MASHETPVGLVAGTRLSSKKGAPDNRDSPL